MSNSSGPPQHRAARTTANHSAEALALVHWSMVHWSIGPFVHWSIGLLVCWSIGPWSIGPLVECQMLSVNKVKLLSERTSGVPPEFLRSFLNKQVLCNLCMHYHPHHHYPVHHFLAVDPVVSSGMDEQWRSHANYR